MKTIFKTKFGSHLYGTDTPESDTDYKGVYMSSLRDIILKKDKEVSVTCTKADKADGVRNSKDDTDVEMKDLRRFLYDCWTGQTYALDMLFAPKEFWIESSPEWEFIVANRQKLLSKNVQPYIGYCRQQAGKYGLKGSRLGELKRVIEHLELAGDKSLVQEAVIGLEFSEFVYAEELPMSAKADVLGMFLNVLGKKFQFNTFTHQALFSLTKMHDEYGKRAIQAMNNEGVDWKAVSHAFRCCFQLIELAETKNINFPLKEADYIKSVKQGKLNYADIQDDLYNLMEKSIKAVESSDLPDKPDVDFWNDYIYNLYRGIEQ